MKQKLSFLLAFFLVGASLFAVEGSSIQSNNMSELMKSEKKRDYCFYHIGIRMWQNQCGIWNLPADKSGITPEMKDQTIAWEDDSGDNSFALIGALQFIWYSKEGAHDFTEDWPAVAMVLQSKGYPIEDWMCHPCPWKSKEDFEQHLKEGKLTLLRKILTKKPVVTEQVRLVVIRAHSALPMIVNAIEEDKAVQSPIDKKALQALITERYEQVARENFYAIVDYIHFKGEGTNPTERNELHPQGWGLRQVLETMDQTVINSQGPLEAFIQAAIAICPNQNGCDYNKARYETYRTFFYHEKENKVEERVL